MAEWDHGATITNTYTNTNIAFMWLMLNADQDAMNQIITVEKGENSKNIDSTGNPCTVRRYAVSDSN